MNNNRRLTLEVAGVGYDDSSSLFEMIQRGGHGDTESLNGVSASSYKQMTFLGIIV